MEHRNSFERNIQFSALIKAGEQVREFNFRKPTRQKSDIFYIDVADEKGDRYHFSLIREGERWLIQETKLPPWITSIENKLTDAIATLGNSSLP